jgi:O-acetyl-ADP-ribose deacetylase (regulator of RNase III)
MFKDGCESRIGVNVIHTVGPDFRGLDGCGEDWAKTYKKKIKELRKAVRNTLEMCKEKGYNNIAMPLISSGIFGCPIELAAGVHFREILEFMKENEVTIENGNNSVEIV